MQVFTEFLTPTMISLIILVVTFVIRRVAKEFLSKGEIETLLAISAIAVEGAEQLARIGRIKPNERYKVAIDLIMKEMSARSFTPSLDLVISAIESSVLNVNNGRLIEIEPIDGSVTVHGDR